METIQPTAAQGMQQMISQVLNSWEGQNKVVHTFFAKHADGISAQEVAPGRNRGIYLLGHLTATSDGLLPLLGFGERLFPALEDLFLKNPDRAFAEIPSFETLKQHWEKVNEVLKTNFATLTPEQWLERHTKVSEADFALDPSRNKLNVLLSRIIHQSYHAGQLAFLTPKNA
jgi:hypothetical protein